MEAKRAGVSWRGGLFLLGGLLLGVLLGAALLLGGPAGVDGSIRRAPLTVGAPAPDFTLTTIRGEAQSLRDYRGAPLVVNFWATWCAPCREEMPLLEAVAIRYAGKLTVLGINAGENERQVIPFLDETGITFPVLLDRDQAVSDLYFVRNYPMTLFLDEEGIIRGIHLGSLNEAQLARYLKTLGIAQ